MTQLQKLLENPPLIHKKASGEAISWQLSDEILHYIDQNVSEDSTTVETGAGISTILFAIKGSNHTCICPSQPQVDRIKAYCQQRQINIEKIEFKVDCSEDVLPSLKIDEIDLVLIDGSHAFPIPFIDWYYTYRKLSVGGTMIIDDTQLWTGLVLKQFLILEPEWKFQKNSPPRSAIFTKVEKYASAKWYGQQPYIVKNSSWFIFKAKVGIFLKLLYSRQFNKLSQLITNQLN